MSLSSCEKRPAVRKSPCLAGRSRSRQVDSWWISVDLVWRVTFTLFGRMHTQIWPNGSKLIGHTRSRKAVIGSGINLGG